MFISSLLLKNTPLFLSSIPTDYRFKGGAFVCAEDLQSLILWMRL